MTNGVSLKEGAMNLQRRILSICTIACLLVAWEIALAQEQNPGIEPLSDDEEDAEAHSTFFASAPVQRITARVTDTRVCRTTGTELIPIPGTTVNFTQGGGSPQEVVVTFVADWPRPDASEIPPGSQAAGAFIFLFIDGDRVDLTSEAGGVLVHEGTASSVSNGTHGFTFVTRPIPPGNHVARIFFLDNVIFGPLVPNGTMCVGHRSTVVQHR
jgi:hypothetical protein